MLAGGNANGLIKIWQTQTGKKLITYEGHVIDESDDGFHGVSELVWSPDGTRIASVAGDRTLQVWDATTGQIILTIPFAFTSVAWSPDGTRLVGNTKGKDGKYRVVVWDSKNGQPLFTHRYWSRPGPFSYSMSLIQSVLDELAPGRPEKAIVAVEKRREERRSFIVPLSSSSCFCNTAVPTVLRSLRLFHPRH